MALLLDLGYIFFSALALPWFLIRGSARGGGLALRSRMGFELGQPITDTIWLHGSSVGEISLLKPLIERFEHEMPAARLLISAYSATGYAAARKAYPAHRTIYFPFDLSFVVRRVLKHFSPRLIVIVEAELWPNFLLAAERAAIPIVVINGKMSPKSFRLHARTGLVPMLLRRLPLLAVQAEEHAERLRALGVARDRVHVTGNMKYDMAPQAPADSRADLRQALGYHQDETVLIGGSLHEGVRELLLDAYLTLRSRFPLTLILVPRYPGHAERVVRLASERGVAVRLKSELDEGPLPARTVLVVDTIGDLNRLYGVADVAFVGGSVFYRGSNKGGHNLMEPASVGVPVLFGPFNFSFKEIAADLVDAGGGMLVRDGVDLVAALEALLAVPSRRRAMGEAARAVVLRGRGATGKNFELIRALLRSGAGSTHNAATNR